MLVAINTVILSIDVHEYLKKELKSFKGKFILSGNNTSVTYSMKTNEKHASQIWLPCLLEQLMGIKQE